MKPFFSIILPTKRRLQLIDVALYSLKMQSFKDFEVIVSDDYDTESCKQVVDKYADERFKYVTPPKSLRLGMSGNWEYGLQFAQGQYIGYLQDKMYFYQDALEKVAQCISATNADVVSWNWDFYNIEDEKKSLRGCLRRTRRRNEWETQDPFTVIREKLEFPNYTYQKEGAPGLGTILSGAVKKSVLEDVRKKYGQVFNFYNPDYGPPIPILSFSKKAVELRDNLTVAIPSITSEGARHATYFQAACEFQDKSPCGYERLRFATVPFLRVTNTNMVTADYNYAAKQISGLEGHICNKVNALVAIRKEMNDVIYTNGKDRDIEESKFNEVVQALAEEEYNSYKNILETERKIKKEPFFKKAYNGFASNRIKIKINNFRHRNRSFEWKIFDNPKESVDWIK